MKATTGIFIDKYHPKDNGLCAISIRVTFDRKKRYYSIGKSLTLSDFEKAMGSKPRADHKETAMKLQFYERKAAQIIAEMPVFTFVAFEKRFYTNQAAKDSIKATFEQYIAELKAEDRIGTATSYACAMNSIETFKSGLKYSDLTPGKLREYERWMLDKGSSITTVGIYMRSLRSIFNMAISDGNLTQEYYPFGRKKYEIPSSNNIKKALTLNEIGKIFNYQAEPGSTRELARDYWVFMYLCNGINVKDMALLKYENIKGDYLEFIRAKTVRTKRKVEPIRIALPDRALDIIKKHGCKRKSDQSYIFPILLHGIDAQRERELVQNTTHVINDHIKAIGQELEIDQKITTYSARHSFATVLQRSGVSTEFISEALGHSNLNTTKNYLAGFEDDSKRKASELLTNF